MPTRIQMKRGTAASWTAANPILSDGEIGFETDTSKIKIGNGTSTWTALNYFPADWSALTGKPAVVASGATIQEAKTSINLGNVDNTADADKNVSSALTAANAANAAQATKLTTARTINNVAFDGTADITVPAIQRSVQTITTPTTLGAAANTDYVYFLSNVPAVNPDTLLIHTVIDTDGAADSTTITNLATANPVNLQLYGTARMSTAQKKFGNSSLLFDGSGWARTTQAMDFTGSWTIEGWFYPTQGGFSTLWEIGDTGRPMFPAFYMYSTTSDTGYSLNAWYHVAAVKNAADGTLKIFVNGVQAASMTDTVSWGVAKLVVGKRTASSDSLSQNYYGYIDGLRVAKTAIYKGAFIAPTEPFPAPPAYVAETLGTPTLPTAVGNTNQYTVKNISSGTLTVLTSNSQTIDGSSSSLPMSRQQSFMFVSDGANSRIV